MNFEVYFKGELIASFNDIRHLHLFVDNFMDYYKDNSDYVGHQVVMKNTQKGTSWNYDLEWRA